jgi:hypothetical protein
MIIAWLLFNARSIDCSISSHDCDPLSYNLYRQTLSTIDWDSMFTGHDIDSITYSIRQTITDIANEIIVECST